MIGLVKMKVLSQIFFNELFITIVDYDFELVRFKGNCLADFNEQLGNLSVMELLQSNVSQLTVNVLLLLRLRTQKINKLLNEVKIVVSVGLHLIFGEEAKSLSAHQPVR